MACTCDSALKRDLAKRAAETGPGGEDDHTHTVEPGARFTSTDHGHRHPVEPGARRTGTADGHDHALPAALDKARDDISGCMSDPEKVAEYPDEKQRAAVCFARARKSFAFRIDKVDEDQRLVYGWFSVIEENGAPVVDSQGDVIKSATLVKTAHGFVLGSRRGKVMHRGRKAADVVESVVFTKELQSVLGVDLGKVGWFAAMKVHDDDVWRRVKSGELAAFSIGGVGKRTEIGKATVAPTVD